MHASKKLRMKVLCKVKKKRGEGALLLGVLQNYIEKLQVGNEVVKNRMSCNKVTI